MRASAQSSPSPSHLLTDSVRSVSVLVVAEVGRSTNGEIYLQPNVCRTGSEDLNSNLLMTPKTLFDCISGHCFQTISNCCLINTNPILDHFDIKTRPIILFVL